MENELQLVEAAKAGSVSAFTELVASYRGRLFRFLQGRCASYADAEDALQDTLINAYRYLHSYNANWRFSTWLYRIAIRNVLKNNNPEVIEPDHLLAADSDPLAHVIAAAERDNLWTSARRMLNDEVYTAMWLRYAEDMPVKDIAATLERSLSWTKVNLLRARKALDAELGQTESKACG